MQDDKLGITLQLPAGAAEAFRGRSDRSPSESQGGKSESGSDTLQDHHHHHHHHQLVSLQPALSRDPDDDWNEDIAVPLPVPTRTEADALEETDADREEIVSQEEDAHVIEDDESSKEEEDDDDDNDELSLTPPVSLPVVLVDLERLVGYQPSSAEEVELLRAQVHTALWGSSDEAAVTVSNPQEQEGGDGEPEPDEDDLQLASQFDERAANLFENGIARHSDTSQVLPNAELLPNADGTYDFDNSLRFVSMEYPAYVCQGNGANPPVVMNTARVWKLLLQPHSIAVVDRLLRHLCSCSRSLLWKDSMRVEVLNLAAFEEDFRIRRNQSSELNLWKTARRKEQLDKLYTVRETFEHQIEIARQRLVTLEKERDDKAALEIRRRRLERGEDLGLEAFDFASTVFAFTSGLGNGNMLGLDEEDEDDALDGNFDPPDEERDDYSDEDGYEVDKSGDDGDDDDHDEDADPVVAVNSDVGNLPIPSQGGQSKRRRQAAVRKRRHRLEEAAKEAEHRSKLDAAKEEEKHMREKCTTQELKMAVAVVHSLEGRMEEVEALLESLQDEEWVDEEEGVDSLTPEQRMAEGATGQQPKKDDLTLLDQILAMILGATLPPSGDIPIESHVQKLQDEHVAIVLTWKDHFGRLPPLATSPAAASFGDTSESEMIQKVPIEQEEIPGERTEAMRQIFGIVDNEIDDWEDEAGEVQGQEQQAVEAKAPAEVRIKATSAPPKAGLRPGGRLQ
jgi:hypothetical protein